MNYSAYPCLKETLVMFSLAVFGSDIRLMEIRNKIERNGNPWKAAWARLKLENLGLWGAGSPG